MKISIKKQMSVVLGPVSGAFVTIPASQPSQVTDHMAYGVIVHSYSELLGSQTANLQIFHDISDQGGASFKYHNAYARVLEDALAYYTTNTVLGYQESIIPTGSYTLGSSESFWEELYTNKVYLGSQSRGIWYDGGIILKGISNVAHTSQSLLMYDSATGLVTHDPNYAGPQGPQGPTGPTGEQGLGFGPVTISGSSPIPTTLGPGIYTWQEAGIFMQYQNPNSPWPAGQFITLVDVSATGGRVYYGTLQYVAQGVGTVGFFLQRIIAAFGSSSAPTSTEWIMSFAVAPHLDFGKVLIVDSAFGDDTYGSRNGIPFLTLQAANAAA